MKFSATFVFLCLCFLGINCQTETCYNKFEYEYNVLQKILTLEGNQSTLRDTITQQQDLIVNLTKDLEGKEILIYERNILSTLTK